ncbi:MAG: class I fructose-bisphosphate aldolase [Chloroflexota bacterium]|nr:class I fructose-bisphosphate aldolase [Chloroflexota bacterium]
MNERIKKILSWYYSENPGVLNNLARLLNHGELAGTGRMVILPVDQGFEHGPARSFGVNPPAYDPHYHYRLAIESGCNAYAAPLGFLSAGSVEFAGEIPTILKLNNHDVLQDEADPLGAQTAFVADALRLGCVGIGYTIYPGTELRRLQYEQLAVLTSDARAAGLVVIVWSYARGSDISSEGETALDVIAYSAHIAAELGAHIVKVKLPSSKLEQEAARKAYERADIPRETLADRVRHVIQGTFDGRRIVIFSGGAAKESDQDVLDEARAIRDGGGFGSIIGRNAFQREWDSSIRLLKGMMQIYKEDNGVAPGALGRR